MRLRPSANVVDATFHTARRRERDRLRTMLIVVIKGLDEYAKD